VDTISLSEFATKVRDTFGAAIEYHLYSGNAEAAGLSEAADELLAAFDEQIAHQMQELCPVDTDKERLAALQLSATTLIVVPPSLVSTAHYHEYVQ
jgi:hypothetical protein